MYQGGGGGMGKMLNTSRNDDGSDGRKLKHLTGFVLNTPPPPA